MFHLTVSGEKRLSKALDKYAKATGKTTMKVMTEHAVTVTKGAMRYTEPFGAGAKAKSKGARAITKDIWKVYDIVWQTATKIGRISRRKEAVFLSCVNAGKWMEAEKVASSVLGVAFDVSRTLDPNIHKSQRNRRGRIRRPREEQGVVSAQNIFIYAKSVGAKSGWAKAGWVKAITGLGGGRIPAWIRRHNAPGGYSIDKETIVVWNSVNYLRNILPGSKLGRAIKTGMRGSVRRMETAISKLKL